MKNIYEIGILKYRELQIYGKRAWYIEKDMKTGFSKPLFKINDITDEAEKILLKEFGEIKVYVFDEANEACWMNISDYLQIKAMTNKTIEENKPYLESTAPYIHKKSKEQKDELQSKWHDFLETLDDETDGYMELEDEIDTISDYILKRKLANYKDIAFDNRLSAQYNIRRMLDLIDKNGFVSVYDLLTLTGHPYTLADYTMGWKDGDLNSYRVYRGRDGKFYLDLPDPIKI